MFVSYDIKPSSCYPSFGSMFVSYDIKPSSCYPSFSSMFGSYDINQVHVILRLVRCSVLMI